MIDELLFLCWSRVIGKPWAPDPWLRARQRAAFSVAMAERKVAEVCARRAVIEALQEELLEIVDELDAWAERAHLYKLEAERLAPSSPWVDRRSDDGELVEVTSRFWPWDDARRRYVHVDEELEETATDGE